MKFNKKLISLIMAIVMVVNFSIFGAIQVFAHDAMLNVDYDVCKGEDESDDIDETWYVLDVPPFCYHLGDEVDTIKYYFEETSSDGTYTWTTDVSESVAQEIKSAYANSMKKWNNVYFYSYNDYGVLIKHKIINVVEGTASDHNLSIYPENDLGYLALTGVVGSYELVESDPLRHRHYNEWEMNVYVNHFYVNSSNTAAKVNVVRERTGAHELGHVLGIFDVDNLCDATITDQHHHELLMGYGIPMVDRSVDITYKDIAGVAITRGFHTDDDHKWLYCGQQGDGKHKLSCSICNGVKYESDLNGYSYDIYGSCGENHNLSSGNMIAVASYGEQDYYKCKYCRYVAPFSSIVTQNYAMSYYSKTHHKYANQVEGLEYTLYYEEHTLDNHMCTECGAHVEYITPHHFEDISSTHHTTVCTCGFVEEFEPHYAYSYAQSSISMHRVYCECGQLMGLAPHVLPAGALKIKFCIHCNQRINTEDIVIRPYDAPEEIRYITDAGSYVGPDGNIYLVESDMALYLAGELDVYALVESLNAYPTV